MAVVAGWLSVWEEEKRNEKKIVNMESYKTILLGSMFFW